MTTLDGRTIGFIGLGLMGKPMARNLHAAGAAMIIHNRSQGVVEELAADGMSAAETPADVAAKVGEGGTVIMSLPDTAAVEKVLQGPDGVIGGLSNNAKGAGTLVIDMGTTKVTATRRFAKDVTAAAGVYMDAPVSGGTIGAISGSLTIMVGGPDDALQRAAPLFDVLGQSTTHVGAVGTGQIAKAANQVIVGLNIGAVAEALTLAKKAGADPARVRAALKGGFADSRILEVHGLRMIEGKFEPGGKCVTQRKDMDQALELAAELGFQLPATALNRDLYDKIVEAGMGDLDHAALIKAIDPEGG
ncbi:MAG TPA: NAD(P)-dependent oxidoreductase [Rhodospirillales bacterium]|jgi:3-hydroxyisobutyrate dehydrogenase-like beta-hydroxyacid dehydrogenase|nr:NAD(P)-dependent oxidoreductase [Rhodospirillales bacterium]